MGTVSYFDLYQGLVRKGGPHVLLVENFNYTKSGDVVCSNIFADIDKATVIVVNLIRASEDEKVDASIVILHNTLSLKIKDEFEKLIVPHVKKLLQQLNRNDKNFFKVGFKFIDDERAVLSIITGV